MKVRAFTPDTGLQIIEHRVRALTPEQLVEAAGRADTVIDHEFFGRVFAEALRNQGVLNGAHLGEVRLGQFLQAGRDVYDVIRHFVDRHDEIAAAGAQIAASKARHLDEVVVRALDAKPEGPSGESGP